MGNPIFNQMGGNNQNNGPFGNMANFINSFNQFKQNFKGDAKQQVQDLLNSGKMTQQQFNQIQGMARQLQGILK